MKKYTNKDIAEMAGVSPAAVSIAINGKKGVSEETRKKILEIVQQVNYYPNPNSKRLLSDVTNNIAILLRPDLRPIDQLFYSELTTSVLELANQYSYNLIFSSVQIQEQEIVLPQIIRSRDVDGVLVCGDIDPLILHELERVEIPFVILDSSYDLGKYPVVRADYYVAALTATRHLVELGHRDIAYIGNNDQHNFNPKIFRGFQKVTSDNNLLLSTNRIQIDVCDEESLCQSVHNALSGPAKPTAMLCATDFYAIHAIRYLQKNGIRVPEDLSVVGIDNSIVSRFIAPPLTTVDVDRSLMGQSGFGLLKKLMNNEPWNSVVLPSSNLIVRSSTAPLKRE